MPMRLTLLACLLFLLFICPRCGESMPSACKEFYSLTATQQNEIFKNYSIERQYKIYRCGTTQRHPPDMGLAIYIAEGGQKNIPFLLTQLGDEGDEAMQRYIIFVFELMANRGYLRGRNDVAKQVESVVAKMKVPFLKEVSQESLNKINNSL
jgi:hypothetical protein